MRLFGIALFVHILGVIAIFAGFSMQQRAGARLRGSTRYEEARPWAEVLMMTRSMVPAGAAMVLVTGLYLTTKFGRRPPVWVPAAMLAALFIGIVALTIVNRGFARIAKAVSAGSGPLSGDGSAHIASAGTWSALASANGAALGTLWLMTMKPGVTETLVAVLLPIVIGAIAGKQVGRRARAPG